METESATADTVAADTPDAPVTPNDTGSAAVTPNGTGSAPRTAALDLDGIERDLADVEVALARLDAGSYWTDEVTGAVLAGELLAQHPTARRAAPVTTV